MEVYFDLDKQLDVPVVLDILNRLALGFFLGVILAPPLSTWSRARHAGEGQSRHVLVQSPWVPQFSRRRIGGVLSGPTPISK